MKTLKIILFALICTSCVRHVNEPSFKLKYIELKDTSVVNNIKESISQLRMDSKEALLVVKYYSKDSLANSYEIFYEPVLRAFINYIPEYYTIINGTTVLIHSDKPPLHKRNKRKDIEAVNFLCKTYKSDYSYFKSAAMSGSTALTLCSYQKRIYEDNIFIKEIFN